MQYGLAVTLIKAVEDFLEGPALLQDGSAAAAAEIRRIRAAYPETKMRPVPAVAPGLPREHAVRRPTSRAARC